MLIETACPRCGVSLSIDGAFVGTRRSCTGCGASFVLERPKAAAGARAEVKRGEKLLAFEAACERCQHVLRVDASFAGTRRTCPSCGHVFTVALSEEVQAKVAARRDALVGATRQERVGCPKCYRFGAATRESGAFRCQYCAQATPFDDAEAFGVRLDAIEGTVIAALLAGQSDDAVRARLAQHPREPVDFLTRRTRGELTLLRRRALAAKNQGQRIALGPPPGCDRCGAQVELAPFSLQWSRVEEETTQLHGATAVTIWRGVAVTKTHQVVRTIEEVAYLCSPCDRAQRPPAPGFSRQKRFALPPL